MPATDEPIVLPAGIRLIDYDEKYAEATVAMWRDSKQKALGIPETHTFADHVYFLNQILAPANRSYLAMTASDEVVGFMATDGVFLNQLYIHPGYWLCAHCPGERTFNGQLTALHFRG